MPFTIVREDITKMRVDAIVNAANRQLTQGSGVCGAIYDAAGPTKLADACARLAPIETGEAVHTPGFNLPAKYIIHTVGPMYDDGLSGEPELLRACYLNSLNLAKKSGLKSIAFPLISSGMYGYPKSEAIEIATATINEFLTENEMDVYLAVFRAETMAATEKLLGEVAKYVDEHYVESRPYLQNRPLITEYEFWAGFSSDQVAHLSPLLAKRREAILAIKPTAVGALPQAGFDTRISTEGATFSQKLLELIEAKGKTAEEVYKSADIDKKLFSKIKGNPDYQPNKDTAIAFGIALQLNRKDFDDLLSRAGFALSPARKSDVIISYFVDTNNYNTREIDKALFQNNQPTIFSTP